MSDLYIVEAFNLFVGPASDNNSKHLQIKNLKLPEMEELTQQHHSGGSWGALDIGGLGMKELMTSFKITGYDEQTLSQFGINGRAKYPYFIYGNARSKATGRAIALRSVLWGRLTKAGRSEMKRGDLMEADHEIKEITHYEEYWNGKQKYFWDWETTIWKVDGVLQNADEINNLAIPTTVNT